MREIQHVYMWALALFGGVLVVRWRARALAVAGGLVAWTAIGPWAGWVVIAGGVVLVPALWRIRRDGLSLGRWSE